MSKLLLIDGHSILNRAFYGVPDLTNSEGIHTNAMYGFLNIMFKFIDEEKPDYVTVAFDLSAPTFRHKVYDGYKGTRKPMLPELRQQVPLMKELLTAMNITIVEKEGFEADDILGTIAKNSQKQGIDVSIVSGDRDLLQLADTNIKIRIPKTKKGVTEVEDYYPEDVKELYGVTPAEFIEMKALMGDSSDNIPGAPGIGPKTASALIIKYHNIDNIIDNISELKPPKAKKSIEENIEQIKLSRYLSEIKIDVDVDYDINNADINDMFNQESYKLFKRYDFKNMLKRCDNGTQSEPECCKHFYKVEDFAKAEEVFETAASHIKENKKIGLGIIAEDELLGVSISYSDEDIYYIPAGGFITSDYLKDKLMILIKCSDNRNIVIDNLKDYLYIFDNYTDGNNDDSLEVSEQAFMDIAIAAYLIHPNNERYDYEALAREYLSMLVMSQTELLGKRSIKESFDIDDANLFKLAADNIDSSYFDARGDDDTVMDDYIEETTTSPEPVEDEMDVKVNNAAGNALMEVVAIFLIIGVIILIIVTIVRYASRFRKSLDNDKDEVEYINNDEEKEYKVKKSVKVKDTKDKANIRYRKLYKKYAKSKKVVTKSKLAGAKVDSHMMPEEITSKLITDDEAKARRITDDYEKARYSNGEVSEEDISFLKNFK